MRLTLFALLPLAACAMDEGATDPSTPDVISHLDTIPDGQSDQRRFQRDTE